MLGMEPMNLKELIELIEEAISNPYTKYIAVRIHMDGFPKDEIIINPIQNAKDKLEYYKNTYDDNLVHKHSPIIRIVDFMYSDCFDEFDKLDY